MTTTYTLKVEIGDEDLKVIRAGGYNLCLTKSLKYQGTEMPGNVVFSTVMSKDVDVKLDFTLQDKNQTYMTDKFTAGVPVSSSTNTYDIGQGFTAKFDDHGSAIVTGSPDATKPITIENGWKMGGRIAITNYDPATQKYATNFISLPTLIDSTNNLTPIRKVGVFFHGEYVTDTMIDVSSTKAFEVDLTGSSSRTVRYEDGKWILL